MICPNKICKQEIPDDSGYCDQCGLKILRCSKCGTPGTSKFCAKCGGAMVFKEPEAPITSPPPSATPVSGATVIAPPPFVAPKLLLCHEGGWNLELADGDILGRSTGNHTGRLGAFPVISGKHAQITRKDGSWYITDLGSTNKSYLGPAALQPDVPAKLKNNDIVQLANIKFVVREG
jgi:hypothetical protein